MTAAIVPAGRKAPQVVEIDRNLPMERPEQIGTALAGLSAALAGLSAALAGAIDGADDISLEIDANATGVHYKFRSYRRGAAR